MKSNHVDQAVPEVTAAQRILVIRDQRVIMDSDLAEIYSVTTKRFNEQVKRNKHRFPQDFMFQLTREEKAEVVAKCDHLKNIKYSPYLPNVFTEHGAIMAASVLNSPKAVEMSVYVVRAFVRMREFLATHKEFAAKLTELEEKVVGHDQAITGLIKALRELMAPVARKQKAIGFTADINANNGRPTSDIRPPISDVRPLTRNKANTYVRHSRLHRPQAPHPESPSRGKQCLAPYCHHAGLRADASFFSCQCRFASAFRRSGLLRKCSGVLPKAKQF